MAETTDSRIPENPNVSGSSSAEKAWGGLFEKPRNSAIDYFAPLTPEQRQQLADGADTFINGLIGVGSRTELTPPAKRFFDTLNDWMTGKIKAPAEAPVPQQASETQAPGVGGYYTDVKPATAEEIFGPTTDPEFNDFMASLRAKGTPGVNPVNLGGSGITHEMPHTAGIPDPDKTDGGLMGKPNAWPQPGGPTGTPPPSTTGPSK